MMMALSRVLRFYIFISLLQKLLVALESCESDGSIQLDKKAINHGGSQYKLLKVCLFGHWSYVCDEYFSHDAADKDVALYQSGCVNGATAGLNVNKVPVYLRFIACSGAERRLIECRHGALFNLTYSQCKLKVAITISCSPSVSHTCQNGELILNNTTNILYICIKDQWRTLCSNLLRDAQAHVACRQLNPRKTIISATATAIVSSEITDLFRYHFYCTGEEKNLTDCDISAVFSSICSANTVAGVICETGPAITPMYIAFTSTSSSSVEANWTQTSSDSVQYYTNHTITCTSTHGVYTATQHVNVSAAVNESMHTIITGLMVNTSYNCCVSVYSELGRSEDVCGSVITAGFRTQISVTRSTSATTKPTSVKTDAQCETNSSTLPWVAGIIIGAVLSAVILLTVIVAVYLWRKKSRSQYKMSDSSTERRVSLSQTNQCYSNVTNVTQEPQAYEEFQPNRQDHQPAAADGVYSYADHTVNTNVYDSVPQSNENSDCYGNSKEDTTTPTVDNTALYSLCEQENGAYSQLNRK